MLSKDAGLFKGPRPGIYESVDGLEHICILRLNQSFVPDECVCSIVETVGRADIVIGIREAKGLEVYGSIIIGVSFCSCLV